MEHLIKQYPCIFGEILHHEKFFLNPLFNFHHLNVLIHKYYSRTFRFSKKPIETPFLLVFFCFTNIKKYHIKWRRKI